MTVLRLGVTTMALFALFLPVAAMAESSVIDWTSIEPLSGVVENDELFLEVGAAGVLPLIVLDEPGVTPPRFSLQGTIRYEGVEGIAYLEMWTALEDGSRYFSRTLADSGPVGRITGTSGERQFVLPFELGEGGPTPASLEVNIVTEGAGLIWIGPITVVTEHTSTASATDTTVAQANMTTEANATAAPAATTTTSPPAGGAAGSWTWWALGLGGAALAGVGVRWQSIRSRRADEHRRMDAMDSLRS
jgi:hypothetical protein